MKTALLALTALFAAAAPAEPLRVMTFNVRYPNPDDGANRWELRRDLLVETIRTYSPDVLGTQELFYTQGEYIAQKLPEYKWFGISRRGNREDEHMGVFYRPSKLKLVESGNFWLSETPDKPGSMSWNVSLPRMVTWGLFQIKGTRKRFYFYNTHFPHRREDFAARVNCAKVIAEKAGALPKDVPFIMTGDFNAPAGGEVYKVFEGDMREAWATAPLKFGPEATNSTFAGRTEGNRIDWILMRGQVQPLQAHTVNLNDKGRYPSDHFPVFAVLDVN